MYKEDKGAIELTGAKVSQVTMRKRLRFRVRLKITLRLKRTLFLHY
jgi:hypothetical protein